MRQDTPMQFPIKGIVEDVPFTHIPDGFTPRALNVWPFDRNDEKMRGGKRAGIRRLVANPVDGLDVPILKMRQVARASSAFIDPGSFFTDPDYETEGWELPPPPPPPEYEIQDEFLYVNDSELQTNDPDGIWDYTAAGVSSSRRLIVANPPGYIYRDGNFGSAAILNLVAGSGGPGTIWNESSTRSTYFDMDVSWLRTGGSGGTIGFGMYFWPGDLAASSSGTGRRVTIAHTYNATAPTILLRHLTGTVTGANIEATTTENGDASWNNFAGTLRSRFNHADGSWTTSLIRTSDSTTLISASSTNPFSPGPLPTTTADRDRFAIEIDDDSGDFRIHEIRIYTREN